MPPRRQPAGPDPRLAGTPLSGCISVPTLSGQATPRLRQGLEAEGREHGGHTLTCAQGCSHVPTGPAALPCEGTHTPHGRWACQLSDNRNRDSWTLPRPAGCAWPSPFPPAGKGMGSMCRRLTPPQQEQLAFPLHSCGLRGSAAGAAGHPRSGLRAFSCGSGKGHTAPCRPPGPAGHRSPSALSAPGPPAPGTDTSSDQNVLVGG